MKQHVTTTGWFLISITGLFVTFFLITLFFSRFVSSSFLFAQTAAFFLAAILWMLVFLAGIRFVIVTFTNDICRLLDDMINEEQPPRSVPAAETLFSKLHHKLLRLCDILKENKNQVNSERLELQALISDIAHQVKTPVSNLRMLTDTLLLHPVTEEEKQEFLNGISSQTEKLDFLFSAMVKTSRLETGLIQLHPENCRIYDTLAQALSGIMQSAEQKSISISVDCPDTYCFSHDSRWTGEALFNLLDNAVKYTPDGGTIHITVQVWELYVNISVKDNGCGIPESSHASVFKRFYREPGSIHTPGVGIGLYLTREIITRQGGYIKLNSSPGHGSVFTVFLPITSQYFKHWDES